ncbi:MAG: hypothetical protein QM724_02720 [Flavobacteriales bacterium]
MTAPAPSIKLHEAFDQAKNGVAGDFWLYLPKDEEWSANTTCKVIPVGEEDIPDEIDGSIVTLDSGTIEQIVHWADELSGTEDAAARLDVFLYYYRFDAFPEMLGAPDPPPWEETKRQLDREFYDSLGREREDTVCRKERCGRGAVALSVFCRPHHFENVKGEPCPFND